MRTPSTLAPLLALLVLAACPASTPAPEPPAEPPPPEPLAEPEPAPPVEWDSTGWSLLGRDAVRGASAVIEVHAWRPMTTLALAVKSGDLVIDGVVVTFAGGETYSPDVRRRFTAGSRSRAIDLPGGARRVARVELRYGGGERAGSPSVEIWGKPGRRAAGEPAAEPPPRPRP